MDNVDSRRIEAAEFRETMRSDIAELRQELRDTEGRLQSQIQQLRHDVQRWTFTLGLINTVASVTAIVIALFAMRR